MKRMSLIIIFLVYSVVPSLTSASPDDIDRYRECGQCGMDRKTFGFSRTLIAFDDGLQAGLCSLHCAVTEMHANRQRRLKTLLVADRNSHQLIDAARAVWVIGGSKRGVMTQRPKWAFSDMSAASGFVSTNGGRIVEWEEVLAAARLDAGQSGQP
jgi:nitrous oxide reductase accessory protein NosL